MDRILIRGGTPLTGTIPIGGAKNAALPLMAASLLSAEPLVLANLPDLADVRTMANLLVQHGVAIALADSADKSQMSGQVLELNARHITSTTAPYDLVRKMRASVLVLGPLVARCGRCRVSLPGGCAIGTRPERPARRRDCVPERLGRGHREPADGGSACRGRDPVDQRRARTRDHRSGAVSDRDGGRDRGHRQRPAAGPGRRQPARCPSYRDP